MMSTTKEALHRFEETAIHYIHELDQLKQKPSDNEWSIGQLVQHLISSELYMQLRYMDQCLVPSQDHQVSLADKTEVGAAVFAQGVSHPFVFRSRLPTNIRQISRKAKNS